MQPSKNIPRISISIANRPNYIHNQQKVLSPLSTLNHKININMPTNNRLNDSCNLHKNHKKNFDD